MKNIIRRKIGSLFVSFAAAIVALPAASQSSMPDSVVYVCKLYGQTRKYSARFSESGDTLYLKWGIERNLKWQKGHFAMLPQARKNASLLSYQQPVDGNYITLPENEVFGIVPLSVLNDLKQKGQCVFDCRTFRLADTSRRAGGYVLLHAVSSDDETEMWILDNNSLPLIYSLQNNPCGVNWEISSTLPVSEVHEAMVTDDIIRSDFKSDKQRSAGIYFAYPLGSKSSPSGNPSPDSAAPSGYSPVYISHYGRHGSRYMMNDSDYVKVLEPLRWASSESGLTPLGDEILQKLDILWNEANGRSGELTELGADQHRGIAERMYNRYRSVFGSGKKVEAVSSTVLRCVLSMNAFCRQISDMDNSIDIESVSGNRLMRHMAYTSPELVKFASPDMDWQKDAAAFEKSVLKPERVLSSIFTRKEVRPDNEISFYKALFRVVSSIQNTGLNDSLHSLYKVFTDEELFTLWKAFNYRMYVINTSCPLNEGKGPSSASMLLKNIIDEADKALSDEDVCASLRFGHDTALIRLLALMHVEGCSVPESDPEKYHLAWQDYRVAPMAANLQMIFYRNDKGSVIVKFLHNENEVGLDSAYSDALIKYDDGVNAAGRTDANCGKYYDWSKLKEMWKESLL